MLEPTNVRIKANNGATSPFLGKSTLELQMGEKKIKETVYFSNYTMANFLSRAACRRLGIIPKRFPLEQVNQINCARKAIHDTYSSAIHDTQLPTLHGTHCEVTKYKKVDEGRRIQNIGPSPPEFWRTKKFIENANERKPIDKQKQKNFMIAGTMV